MHASKTMLIRIVLLCCLCAKLCSHDSNGAVYLWPCTRIQGSTTLKPRICTGPAAGVCACTHHVAHHAHYAHPGSPPRNHYQSPSISVVHDQSGSITLQQCPPLSMVHTVCEGGCEGATQSHAGATVAVHLYSVGPAAGVWHRWGYCVGQHSSNTIGTNINTQHPKINTINTININSQQPISTSTSASNIRTRSQLRG
jgi:hypothetical protein